MRGRLKVSVLMDQACVAPADPEFLQHPAEPTTEHHVVNALRELGHTVAIIGVGGSVDATLAALAAQMPDIVFNLTEVFRDSRCLDKNIAALLEMLGIPFTGTGSTGLMLCRDKGLCKQLLALHKVRVPGFSTFVPGRRVRLPKALRYPMVVKPALTDGSEGISNASLVRDEAALTERVRLVHERWRQPAIAEEYVEGRELYVGVLGNARLTALPARELFFSRNGNGTGPVLATYRVKWDPDYQKKWQIQFGLADLEERERQSIARVCKNVYRILQLQDYGRIDLRLTPENRIVILEVNPNPDIAYGEEVAEAAENAGISYNLLVERILRLAWRRYRA